MTAEEQRLDESHQRTLPSGNGGRFARTIVRRGQRGNPFRTSRRVRAPIAGEKTASEGFAIAISGSASRWRFGMGAITSLRNGCSG
jgi:hypothetical protein